MDSRFAHLYKRDSSVSMIRVKMSRRRSQTQKENREKMQNLRRHLDQLPELELSMDASTLEKSVVHAHGTKCKTKEDKSRSAAEERKKLLERFKENKALQKEKEKREKEKKGVFKVGLYRPQPQGYLPLNPVVLSAAKSTDSMHSTRVTRSMKQQPKLPTERQAVPRKAVEQAHNVRANKPSAIANGRSRTAAGDATSVPIVENKPAEEKAPTVNQSPVKEKVVEEPKVTPTSFAPQGFVFQPPSGLRAFQPAPLSPRSADAFLSPSFCFETKTESASPPSDTFVTAASPSSPPFCLSNPVPAHSSCAPSPPASSTVPPASSPPPPAPVEPQHDVSHFRTVMADETERLTRLSELWELRFDDPSIPEEMRDRMRTAVGQARLLMKERFGQFNGLVDDCDLGRGEKITTCSDLQGFWDMVYFQVEDVNKKFNALKEAEARGWQEEAKPVTKQKKVVKKPPVAGGKTGAGGGASAAAKSRLAAVKAAMKAKAAAEKAAVASDDTTPASDAPANPLAAQTVVFQGGFFRVESPIKVAGSPRVRMGANPLPQSSPFVSKYNTPGRQRSAVSHSSPNPRMTIISNEFAPSTPNYAKAPHPAACHSCTPQRQRPAEPHQCPFKTLQISPEHHRSSLHASPTGVMHTEPTQSDLHTSDCISNIQSEIKLQSSPGQLEAKLPVCLPEHTDADTKPEGCIQESLSQEQAEEPMFTELTDSPSACPAPGASPLKPHTFGFTLSPSTSKAASPRAEIVEPSVSAPSRPLTCATPPQVCVVSPAPSDINPVNERSAICATVEMTENLDAEPIEELDFERYLQQTARLSISPLQRSERFSLGAADAEMESPQFQAEESVQDVMMTPTAFPGMSQLVFTPWTEQLMDNPLPFTPEQRDRVRQSVCDRDLMMFTPPSSK
ncbi:hypothetical protein NFI96_012346 [Prochilodus magdalenae]|nr:hypothetical protein NFI96_012346 [Prochilodus magdalenae]